MNPETAPVRHGNGIRLCLGGRGRVAGERRAVHTYCPAPKSVQTMRPPRLYNVSTTRYSVHTMSVQQPLSRMRHDRTDPDSLPRYFHPAGFVIRKERRDWDMRGYRDTVGSDSPKEWWEVYRAFGGRRFPLETFARLRDARAWCDAR